MRSKAVPRKASKATAKGGDTRLLEESFALAAMETGLEIKKPA